MIPSIKTLKTICPERAVELRKILEIQDAEQLATLATKEYPTIPYSSYALRFGMYGMFDLKLAMANEILGTHGVEYIGLGHNSHSPAITYCNTGDTYAWTLLYIHGTGYRVGSWGDLVERGNYD